MKPNPTLLIIASEPSGERQAAALMHELNAQYPNLKWVGVGGPLMQAQGLKTLFPQTDLAVMGIVEVLCAIPRIRQRLQQIFALAQAAKPNVVITIDGQEFSQQVAKKLKPLDIAHVQYVAPKVWAWRQGRVHKLKHLYTHLLCNLPFEAAWFSAAGLPTTYVGHPMVAQLGSLKWPTQTALQLALLPGSRGTELARHWPLMLATYRRLKSLIPPLTGLLTLPDEAAVARCRALAPWDDAEGLEVVVGEGRFAALTQCRAALAKSGTNNLELAFLNLPAVVCYRMNPISFALVRRLVKVKYVSLPNLLLNPPAPLGATPLPQQGLVFPEFIQAAAKPQNLARALYPLLTQAKPHRAQQQRLATVRGLMQTPKPAAHNAAGVVVALLKAAQRA